MAFCFPGVTILQDKGTQISFAQVNLLTATDIDEPEEYQLLIKREENSDSKEKKIVVSEGYLDCELIWGKDYMGMLHAGTHLEVC